MPDVPLEGCTTEPLMSYLKALGVLRLIAEDRERGDPAARGCWRHEVFVLRSRFEPGALVSFLELGYRPTPIVVPWSMGYFFGVNEAGDAGPFPSAPTQRKIIESFLATTTARLAGYRQCIRIALGAMKEIGLHTKSDLDSGKGVKSRLLGCLRSRSPETAVAWIDAAAVIEADRPSFNALLGSGGGSDGHTHYSDNFMQNLWDVLPDFDSQRKGHTRKRGFLENTLFGVHVAGLSDRTSSLFDSGAVGGPNAAQGFEGGSVLNPWDFILALEGTLCLAGAVSRKLGAAAGASAFPFSVLLSAAGYGTAARKEENQREIWLPLWERFAGLQELRLVFAEGRAQVGSREARTGADFARAVTSMGVDRGIRAFSRFGIVRGRVGGENYNTAVPLGRYEVRQREETQLVREVDGWLGRFRQACRDDTTPPRFQQALNRIERAILSFCRYGGSPRMGEILRALGNAERELANGEKFRTNERRTIPPIGPLTPAWLRACDDGSPEFRLGASVASICGDVEGKVGDLRTNVEPVVRAGRRWEWAGESVGGWGGGTVAAKLLGVIQRRVMDGRRENLKYPALWGRAAADLEDVSAFLWRLTDDGLMEEYLWGLILIDRSGEWPERARPEEGSAPPLPRSFALLKLAFLPGPLKLAEGAEPISIASEEEILGQLRGSRTGDACRIAARRLRSSGLTPMVVGERWLDHQIEPERLGAGLIFPIWQTRQLAGMVLRPAGEEQR